MELELFEKTEIWIQPIQIRNVNLGVIAEKVADVLRLKKTEIMVVDVREDLITLDIMKKAVHAKDITGKKEAILLALKGVPGVTITSETNIHSEGILGLIDLEDRKATEEILERMEQMGREISTRVSKRAIIFPSGSEIQTGLIQDTNSPHIKTRLTEEGYEAIIGNTLEDNLDAIVASLNKALNEGFGLIITTGGVGAENKDRMVEALLTLDPEASTPYIIRYERGTGRHEKDGVKIGVGYLKPSLIITLPGPHEEAKMGIEVILEGLKKGWDKETFALFLSKKYIETLKQVHHSF